MKTTKPFRPLVLILIGGVLALMTGALVLTWRQAAAPEPQPSRSTAAAIGSTTSEPRVESGTATASPSSAATATQQPASAVTSTSWPAATATAEPTLLVTPVSARPVEVEAWKRVQIADAGMGLQVPENWRQLPENWAWSPDGSADLSVGLTWIKPAADWTANALLPPAADMYETKPVNLGWSSGTSVLVEVLGEMATLERHVIVRVSDELAVDFYARAGTSTELVALEAVLDEMLKSIIVNAYAGDPVDVSVQFLAALLNNEDAQSYLSNRLREVVEGGRSALSLLGMENLYSSFSVSLISADNDRMIIKATLDLGSNRVEERLLALVQEDGAWRIDEITRPG